ncbi:MAG: xanthine dehydrogenase accessory factor [Verrucomicrobiota bacterium]|jgi:xanthine/CO dehydrogenase XdhC/CoxF family maturation factor
MLIMQSGATVGSVSAGCLEEEVAIHGAKVLRTGLPAIVSFDTRRRFGCDGSIEIFIERAADDFFAELARNFASRRPCVIMTVFDGADHLGSFVTSDHYAVPSGALCQRVEPPLRLIIVGDKPEGESLKQLATLLGWEIVSCASAADLPGETDSRTAAVVKTHHYGQDCAALRALLPMELSYVGLIGPRRRRDEILSDLLDSGVELRSQLFAPAGLDLGAEGPEEIALSVIGEIEKVFGEGSGESLRDRRAPIHLAKQKVATEFIALPKA